MIEFAPGFEDNHDMIPLDIWDNYLCDRETQYPTAEFQIDRYEIPLMARMWNELIARRYSRSYSSVGGGGTNGVVFFYLLEQWSIRITGSFTDEQRTIISGVRDDKDLVKQSDGILLRQRRIDEPVLDRPHEFISLTTRERIPTVPSITLDDVQAPKHRFAHPVRVIIIRGPLGVGKTYTAEWIAAKLDGQYFSIDDALSMCAVENSDGDYTPDDFIRAQEFILPQIQRSLREGYTVVLDGNFYFKEQIKHLKEHIKKPLLIFTLRASLEECIARDRMRTHSFGEESARAIYTLVTKLDIGTPVDTEKRNPNDVVDEILNHVKRMGV